MSLLDKFTEKMFFYFDEIINEKIESQIEKMMTERSLTLNNEEFILHNEKDIFKIADTDLRYKANIYTLFRMMAEYDTKLSRLATTTIPGRGHSMLNYKDKTGKYIYPLAEISNYNRKFTTVTTNSALLNSFSAPAETSSLIKISTQTINLGDDQTITEIVESDISNLAALLIMIINLVIIYDILPLDNEKLPKDLSMGDLTLKIKDGSFIDLMYDLLLLIKTTDENNNDIYIDLSKHIPGLPSSLTATTLSSSINVNASVIKSIVKNIIGLLDIFLLPSKLQTIIDENGDEIKQPPITEISKQTLMNIYDFISGSLSDIIGGSEERFKNDSNIYNYRKYVIDSYKAPLTSINELKNYYDKILSKQGPIKDISYLNNISGDNISLVDKNVRGKLLEIITNASNIVIMLIISFNKSKVVAL